MQFQIDFLASHDPASIVAELQRIAKLLGKRAITTKEIDEHGYVSSATVMQKFGTMRKAHEAAGLVALRYTKSTNEELMRVVADLWTITLTKFGRRPRMSEVSKYGFPVSSKTIVERFGSWKKALIATAAAHASGKPAKKATPQKPVRKESRRQNLSVNKRYLVMKRDNYTCRLCRKPGGELEVDHITPVSRGGGNTMDNLQTLCKPCNRGKGAHI
jgi:hypothetical protein